MKVLILTSINPVLSGSTYSKLTNSLKGEIEADFMCYPFIADMIVRSEDKSYLPAFFSVIEATSKREIREKVYKNPNRVVIGNCYKQERFDFIVSFNDTNSEPFDPYIEKIKNDEDYEKFKNLIRLDDMYTAEDAKINIPSMHHLILFLQGVYEKNEIQPKAN